MSDELLIREAQLADVDTIADFNCRLAQETEDNTLDPATVTRGVTRFLQGVGAGFYIVAELQGRIAGCLMVTHEWSDWKDGNVWWIQSVYVPAEARRRGVFRALFTWVQQRAEADSDVRGIRLYVEHDNERAQHTYKSLGMAREAYHMYGMLVGNTDRGSS